MSTFAGLSRIELAVAVPDKPVVQGVPSLTAAKRTRADPVGVGGHRTGPTGTATTTNNTDGRRCARPPPRRRGRAAHRVLLHRQAGQPGHVRVMKRGDLMPANRNLRTRAAVTAALVLAICVGLSVSSVAGAAPSAVPAAAAETVKYYEVKAAYSGKPENLSEIATRFLGDGSRSTEIFELNVGREQPDGASLKDANTLHRGWYLVLPWDAVGDGVQIGELPAKPKSPTKPKSQPTSSPPTGGARPTPTGTPTRGAAGQCATASTVRTGSNWAPLRMAPSQAWARTKGDGVVVAVVDSGVDATLPELTGRVAVGADIVSGSGRGNTDCLGTGTAMAGIIAAQPGQGNSLRGIAPEADILPIRVVTTAPSVTVADQASAIEVAVSAGAKVIALGSYVDIRDPKVAQAVAAAGSHNVVVVAGAPTRAGASAGQPPPGLLRVAGVGVDNKPAADYRPGEVDVVAPGVGIAVLGISGTGGRIGSGTNLAVAFVAGEAALVRAAYPDLNPAQVVQRVKATADKMGNKVPDPTYGWGIINPSAAVNQALRDEQPAAQPPVASGGDGGSSPSAGSTLALVLLVLLGLVAVAAFAFRVRRMVAARAGREPTEDPDPQPAGGGDGSSSRIDDAWRAAVPREKPVDSAGRGAASAAETAADLPATVTAGAPDRPARGADSEQR
ncbi:S8 family serine peptidase [Micromonospora fulviviridis]|uniref:S8 family serine peptidase n=1 Tax=Micromonospora fulviviridis TaxID=47860 RepID=UPI0033FE093D